ncbi:MAG: hypothetical protein ABI574_05845 [Burkholderiales bacterium]
MPPPTLVTTGHFILRPMANPPLKAGDYTLTGAVDVNKADDTPVGAVQAQATHLRISSPRFQLPPEQLLSCFPPANSEGAYENRLPQIVLKRRTLPWEREPAPGATTTPWLALVVIAEGEAALSGDTPVAGCVTPGVVLTGPSDVATGNYLSVTRTVIDKVFPKKEELALLCHVREVDVNDTELANGDDDGFLATVIANRLPQFDRTNNKPVRYMACLINVEGQLEELAKPPPPVVGFHALAEVFDYRAMAVPSGDPDRLVMGTVASAKPVVAVRSRAAPGGSVAAARIDKVAAAAPAPSSSKHSSGAASQWQTTTQRIEQVALTASENEAGRLVRDVMLEGYRGNLEHLITLERTYRFPVLQHWSFTVSGSGGFESLMRGLDVGLLGTAPEVHPPPPGAPPKPAEPRPAPEFTETGHVGLPHLTRRGDRVRAWYRGPLGSFPTTRDAPDVQGRLPLAHVSDQLRRSVPDGREDLSLAAAFEIGRLLALSQPSVVRALLAWRAEQFGASRAAQILGLLKDAPKIGALLKNAKNGLAELLSRHLVLSAAEKPGKVLAPTRPVVDPGRELPYAKEGGLDKLISEGFGFSAAQVGKLRQGIGTVAALQRTEVPVVSTAQDGPVLRGAEADRLRAGLDAAVDRLTANSIGQQVPGGGLTHGLSDLTHVTVGLGGPRGRRRNASTERAPDALDDLLARASARKGRMPESK